jgi:hypothetical protein
MADFWKSSGYHLLDQRDDGYLGITDAFLRALIGRPEMALQPESCPNERNLHAALIENPARPVSTADIDAIADPDGRDNFRILLAFRDRLIEAETIEGCYLRLFRSDDIFLPSLFIDQMVHVILRNVLNDVADPQQPRAGELLFRSQKVSLNDGAVLLADEETVEMKRQTAGFGELGRMLVEMDTSLDQVKIDVLAVENADAYWERSDRYDLIFDMTFGRAGLDALARVLESWIAHLLKVDARIEPVREIQDDKWSWHIGLDANASTILNQLYDTGSISDEHSSQLLSLFRLELADDVAVNPRVSGKPIYLGLAMDSDKIVRLKPQNLLVNMPLVPVS